MCSDLVEAERDGREVEPTNPVKPGVCGAALTPLVVRSIRTRM